MSISISIHVDGYYGLTKGVNKLLNLFDKYDLKASFFINMGREANIFDLFKYRTKNLKEADKKIAKRYDKFQILRMLILPQKLGFGHCNILRKIQKRGHEVNPHAWSHLLWSKNFENLKRVDINNEISKMYSQYFKCIGKFPIGFVPPDWKWDSRVIEELKFFRFKYLGIDNKFKKPYLKNGILLIPLSFKYTPEELLAKGFGEEEIIRIYKKHIQKKDYVNLYFHADYEGLMGIHFFEKILKLFEKKKTTTYEKIYNKFHHKHE